MKFVLLEAMLCGTMQCLASARWQCQMLLQETIQYGHPYCAEKYQELVRPSEPGGLDGSSLR